MKIFTFLPQVHFMYIFILCLISSLLYPSKAYTQEYTATVETFGIKEGLSSYNVNHIIKDQKGFIWIGTDMGLNRYDGQSFKSYTQKSGHIPFDNIQDIDEWENGQLIIRGESSLGHFDVIVFDPITEKFQSIHSILPQPMPFDLENLFLGEPISVQLDSLSIIFHELNASDQRNTIHQLKQGKWSKSLTIDYSIAPWKGHIPYVKAELGGEYFAICFHDLTTDRQAYFLNREGGQRHLEVCPTEYSELMRFVRDDLDSFALCSFPVEEEKYVDYVISQPYQKEHSRPLRMSGGDFNNRIGMNHQLFFKMHLGALEIYNFQGELLQRIPLDIEPVGATNMRYAYVDEDNHIWFQGRDQLYHISLVEQHLDKKLVNYNPQVRVRGIGENQKGELTVVGTGHSFYQQKGKQWTKRDRLIHEGLGVLQEDSILWVGTEHEGLACLNTNTDELVFYYYDSWHNVIEEYITWIPYRDRKQNIWVGTQLGIYKLNKDTIPERGLQLFGNDTSSILSQSTVYHFYETRLGTWLSTSKGLFLVDLEKEEILAHYFKDKHLAHIHEDVQGILWIACKGSGLIAFNPQTKESKQYTKENTGLSHNVLYAVYGDDYNNLWIASNYGLMCFNKETLSAKTYLKEDGLPHNEFNTIAHYKDAKGKLYFGGQNGIVSFYPKDLLGKEQQCSFVITSYTKQDRSTDSIGQFLEDLLKTSTICLRPDDKYFSLEFALLDYHNSTEHQYSYQIEGYDKEWNYSNENKIKINGFPYGNYKLRLRAKAASSSVWTDYPQVITIKVLKPFYLQWWFTLLCVALLIGVILTIAYWREQRLEQRKRELEEIVRQRTTELEKDKKLIEAQADELKTLDKVKSKFFANISHELRTPLTLILGPLSHILDKEQLTDKLRQQMNVMFRNSQNLLQLVEEILDLSKLEASKLELQEEATSLSDYVDYVVSSFKGQLETKQIDFQVSNYIQTPNLHILLDRKKMEKVLNNFLSNALKFTPKGGSITLSIKDLGDQLQFCVQDTGKGIHPEDLPYVFDRFFQSKQADQQLYGGTGIGLALVREFAQLMQGQAYAESVLGEGSQFFIEFPKKEVNAQVLSFSQEANKDLDQELIGTIGREYTVLLVEDNEDMRNFVAQLLQQRYQRVLLAENGQEGLELLQKHQLDIDLIISDVMMPEVNGLTMLKQIKTHETWFKIPVIMLTALAAERDRLKALTLGCDDYLCKPFSIEELIVRTQNVLYNYQQRKLYQAEEVVEEVPQEEEAKPLVSSADLEWIKELEQIIESSITTTLVDVEVLAKTVFLSKRQLNRKVKLITGLTPLKLIREVQLKRAMQYIEEGQVLSITEIAYKTAFEHSSTFSTLFKQRFGQSPSVYLKKGIK